jgi:hypothetical protein
VTLSTARAVEVEHQVRRLEIAVDHAARVRVRQAGENLIDHRM